MNVNEADFAQNYAQQVFGNQVDPEEVAEEYTDMLNRLIEMEGAGNVALDPETEAWLQDQGIAVPDMDGVPGLSDDEATALIDSVQTRSDNVAVTNRIMENIEQRIVQNIIDSMKEGSKIFDEG